MKTKKVTYIIFLLAISAGMAVANIYYAQPILPLFIHDLNTTYDKVGLIPMITQLGYAMGIFFLLPLADKYNRRHLILIKGTILSFGLAYIGITHTINSLILCSLIIGLMSTIAQDIVPIAAIISPSNKQGKYVGSVMTGLLLGILLSRTISGVFSDYFGWNLLFIFASILMLSIVLLLWMNLPNFEVNKELKYSSLLLSLKTIWIQYPLVRKAVYSQGCLSLSFSAFWSTLALFLANKYGLSSSVAGLFGIAGAAGAIAAPIAGLLSDKLGHNKIAQLGSLLVAVFFSIQLLLPYTNFPIQMIILALSAVGFDLGVQASLISNQSMIYRLDPKARGRLNAILFTGVFMGMALGSWLGNLAYLHFSWNGVILLCIIFGVLGLIINKYK